MFKLVQRLFRLLMLDWYPSLSPGVSILLWGLSILFATGGIALFLINKKRWDQERKELINAVSKQQSQAEKLWRLIDTMSLALTTETPILQMLIAVKKHTAVRRAYLYLYDIRQEFFHAIGTREDLNLVEGFDIVPKSYGRIPALIDNLQPFIVKDFLHPEPNDGISPRLIEDGNLSSIVVPITQEDDLLGVMPLIFDRYLNWDDQEIEFYMAVGRVVGILVQMEMRSEKTRELAVLRERRHLSQELHDNFSQLISALAMRAEAAQLSCEEGKLEKTAADLSRIISTAREIQGILRDEMVGLRSYTAEINDILPMVRAFLVRFENLSNIGVTLEEESLPPSVVVPTQVGAQFFRILQECLSNVRRHSKAKHVTVRIQECEHRLCLEIEDDGQGFNQDHIPPDRLGLHIVRERVQELDGDVTIRSTIGGGTYIRVELPIFQSTSILR